MPTTKYFTYLELLVLTFSPTLLDQCGGTACDMDPGYLRSPSLLPTFHFVSLAQWLFAKDSSSSLPSALPPPRVIPALLATRDHVPNTHGGPVLYISSSSPVFLPSPQPVPFPFRLIDSPDPSLACYQGSYSQHIWLGPWEPTCTPHSCFPFW